MKPMHIDLLPTLLGPLRTLLNKKADKTEVIKTINGEKPDANGNAVVEIPTVPASIVQTINGQPPDGSGNAVVNELPATASVHQQLVTDGDGVAKWEDKAFYETFAYGSESYGTDGFNSVDVGGVYRTEDAFSISLDASKRYAVMQYPGYVCEVKTTQGMKYIGNTTISGFGEDTGEPFIVVENPDTGRAFVILKEAPASKLFFVRDVVETIKPIDAKFLPTLMLTRTREGYSFNTDYSTFRNSVAQGAILVFNDALNGEFYHGGNLTFNENDVVVRFEAEGYLVAQVSFGSDGAITDLNT